MPTLKQIGMIFIAIAVAIVAAAYKGCSKGAKQVMMLLAAAVAAFGAYIVYKSMPVAEGVTVGGVRPPNTPPSGQ